MRIHLVQFEIAWEDRPENYRRVRELVDSRVASRDIQPGDLIALPEMFDTGFSFNLEKTVDRDGRTMDFLKNLARSTRCTVQGARSMLGSDGKGRNNAPIFGPGGELLAEYTKIHPFSFGKESQYFSGGDAVVTYAWTHETEGSVTVCPAICYDLRFPELFRLGMLKGAELFIVGANWPAPRAVHRSALLIARAIENQAYVAGINRVGRDVTLEYAGESMLVEPRGEVVARLGTEQAILSAEISPAHLREWRETFPAWKDIRLMRHS